MSYDPATGESEVRLEGNAATAYSLVEALDLDFDNPDPEQFIAPTGATVGTLNGAQIVTDDDGNATVQFNLGAAKIKSFIRAVTAVQP